jgi:hypothetical protein
MPLNDADRAWIREAIQTAHKTQGWGKLTRFVRDWSGAGAAVAIILLVFTQWTAYIEFRTNTNNSLNNINSSLTKIDGELARQQLSDQASLSPNEFRAALPRLSSVVSTLRKQGLTVPPSVISGIQQKLLATDRAADGYWPTTAEFISYRSQVATSDWERLLHQNLPNCRDLDPGGGLVKSLQLLPGSPPGGPSTVVIENPHYSNCRLALDSPEDGRRINSILKNQVRITFTHCFIVYRGGKIDIIMDLKNDSRTVVAHNPTGSQTYGTIVVSGPTLEFVDCLLDFAVTGQPHPSGKKLTDSLLAENGPTLTLP